MSDIDFLTCSMDDVIERSLRLHPAALAGAMQDAYRAHDAAANTMLDGPAVRMAREMATVATELRQRLASRLLATRADMACLSFNQRIMLFGAAYKLQCVPLATAMDIAARSAQ